MLDQFFSGLSGMRLPGLALAAAISLSACDSTAGSSEGEASGERATDQFVIPEGHGLQVQYMDTTVSPRENFFMYANGGYLQQHEIPEEESRWGVFSELRENTDKNLHDIMKQAAGNRGAKGSPVQLIGDFYTSAMDTATIEEMGIKAIDPELDMIANISSPEDLVKVMAKLHRIGVGVGFNVYVGQDAKDSRAMLMNVSQGGLGLPDRDYYFREDESTERIRKAYFDYIQRTFVKIGRSEEDARNAASTVMALETMLAKHSLDRVARRDPDKTYNKMPLEELIKIAPGLNWELYFSELGVDDLKELNVAMPDFMTAAASAMGNPATINDWKTYLTWHTVSDMSGYLSQEFVQSNFEFSGRVLQGTEKIQPRWKRVVGTANWTLGFALGKLYVEEHFSPRAKAMAEEMVDNILAVMKERLANLEWMSQETREQAIGKVETIMPKIGYPDKWRDYSSMDIHQQAYARNVISAREWGFEYRLDQLGKPVDRSEWGMPPQIVNAYYNPSLNEIVFPAGILQAPFFDEHVDAALNYGGFGAVIGHELIHAFDDQGSKYDKDGNLMTWWTQADREAFEARADMVVKQYEQYMVLGDVPVNGKLTLGENIADIDGLRISFYAWKRSLGSSEAPSLDGFTPEQRFFVNYGQIWAGMMRDEALRMMVMTNPHSPAEFRVIGSTSNLPEFYAAFDVQEGDPMYRNDEERIVIW